ncbi:MAG: thioredoxin domain-containing protein [Myxococcales bacterium]|nr:thioredoxin domain-containing protein [Myxococcales bacterium]MCB9734158.1 thioredoxin domain-containing protein [Deltaproteobacteria bacterium]
MLSLTAGSRALGGLLATLALGGALAACASAPAAPCRADGAAAAGPDDGGAEVVVARLGDHAITRGELDAQLAEELAHARLVYDESVYDARERALTELTRRLVLEREADRRGLPSVDALIAQEVTAKVAKPTQAEIEATYRAHEEELDGQPLEEVAGYIGEYLEGRAAEERLEVFIKDIARAQGLEVTLEPPRVQVEAVGPSRGPDDAPVTIVMFSDYECPYCHRGMATMREVMARYPREVRLVYRHFPLSIHEHAQAAAAAAVCAEAQGRFWPVHDAFFGGTEPLDDDRIEEVAAQAGLDAEKLEACMDAPSTAAKVEADQRAGLLAAVQGTPAFFINGIRLEGAHPASDFVRIIEGELARKRARAER